MRALFSSLALVSLAACSSGSGAGSGPGPANDLAGGLQGDAGAPADTMADAAGADGAETSTQPTDITTDVATGVAVDVPSPTDIAAAGDMAHEDGFAADVPVSVVDAPVAEVAAADASGPDSDAGSKDEWFTCVADEECTVIELKCCDYCNGGEALAVAKGHAADAKAALGTQDCGGMMCTEEACQPLKASCNAGHCALGGPSPACGVTPAAKLCVRGTPTSDGETVAAGDPMIFDVTPGGCWSSSCTVKVEASCTATPGDVTIFVKGSFCLGSTGAPMCTADCGGGGFASCSGGIWYNGTWPVALEGAGELGVTVPSTLPFGGVCVGSQF